MRIKFTPPQILVIKDHLSAFVKSGDIVLGATYADIEPEEIADIRDYLGESGASGQAAAGVFRKLTSSQVDPPTAGGAGTVSVGPEPSSEPSEPVDPPSGTPEPAEPASEPSPPTSSPDPDPLALPRPVSNVLARIVAGDYGPEPQRLAKGMDDRPNERATRWVGRLRHKLTSNGDTLAAHDLHLTPLAA